MSDTIADTKIEVFIVDRLIVNEQNRPLAIG